jgi:hypothetical protein
MGHLLDFGMEKIDLGRYVQIIARKGGIMGLGMRIFIVKDDGSLERLPFGRYNRLLQRHPSERLFQYAGKRVRCAVIVVESINRKPVEILKCQYSYLSFDSDGMIKKGGEGEVKLAMDMLEPVIIERAKQLVDARHKFARKRYAREYRWEPSPGIEVAIRKAIFG